MIPYEINDTVAPRDEPGVIRVLCWPITSATVLRLVEDGAFGRKGDDLYDLEVTSDCEGYESGFIIPSPFTGVIRWSIESDESLEMNDVVGVIEPAKVPVASPAPAVQ